MKKINKEHLNPDFDKYSADNMEGLTKMCHDLIDTVNELVEERCIQTTPVSINSEKDVNKQDIVEDTDWGKRFDEEFPHTLFMRPNPIAMGAEGEAIQTSKDIKKFIKSLLREQKESLGGEIYKKIIIYAKPKHISINITSLEIDLYDLKNVLGIK